ncbi:MAG: thymidylate kinase [Candidatus Uhrbacteria bacterium]|nr:thymidylate kinase [Candidatus Uhrbacteria bacterium]
MSSFIVIDGTDGSGKGTQTKKLVERLQAEGRPVKLFDFPRYGNPSAYFVEKYLRGEYGNATDVGAYRASLFYALDRYDASFDIRRELDAGTIVISNRYVSASKGHQMGKITDPEQRLSFLRWLNELEYKICGIPKPDMTVLLHVPAEIGYELVAKKDERGYLDGKKRDIHEADPEHLRAAETAYLELPKIDREERWTILECTENGQLLSINEIHERLWKVVMGAVRML